MSESVLMMMLCQRCAIGGAEKRYARLFEMLTKTSGERRYYLLINQSLLDLLRSMGLLQDVKDEYLIVIPRLFGQNQPTPAPSETQNRRKPKVVRLLMGLLEAFWSVWQVERAVHRLRPDVVHPLLAAQLFCIPALYLHRRVRYIVSAYTSYPVAFESQMDNRILGISPKALLRRHLAQRAHAIDALSDAIRTKLSAAGMDAAKIFVAPGSFTDISLCQPVHPKRNWVVFLGRLIETKNPRLFLEAIPHVIAAQPDAHFFLLGNGPLLPQLEARIAELGIANHITIRFEATPTQILNQSAIFASLQRNENYPSQSLLEAMACENAIVATDVGETYKLVDETNGIRVPPHADAVATAILELLQAPDLAARQHASRQRILAEHSPENFVRYIEKLYFPVQAGSRAVDFQPELELTV